MRHARKLLANRRQPLSIFLLDRTDVLNCLRPTRPPLFSAFLRVSAVNLALGLLPAAQPVILDRIAVSVGNQVITVSDIDREIRVAAFLNGNSPDLSAASRRNAADQLVEQTLVRKDIESSRYPMPPASEADSVYEQFVKDHFTATGALDAALKTAGVTGQDVKSELLWQRTLLSFLDVRFRPAVQVTDAEIQTYFDTTVKATAEAAHPGQAVSVGDYHDQIEEVLTGKKEDQEMDRWLADARKRTAIVYHDEVFQ